MTSYYRPQQDNRPDDIFSNIKNVIDGLNHNLEKDVRSHLKNVYSTLTLSLVTFIFGF